MHLRPDRYEWYIDCEHSVHGLDTDPGLTFNELEHNGRPVADGQPRPIRIDQQYNTDVASPRWDRKATTESFRVDTQT